MHPSDLQSGTPQVEATESQVEYEPGTTTRASAVVAVRNAFAEALASDQGPKNADWEAILLVYGTSSPFQAVMKGREKGVPPRFIECYAAVFLHSQAIRKSYGVIAGFLERTEMGSPELIAYFRALAAGRQPEIAAMKLREFEEAPPHQRVEIPPEEEATMADLFRALQRVHPALNDRFRNDVVEACGDVEWFLDLEGTPEAEATLVVDAFGESAASLLITLPLLQFAPGAKEGD